MKPKERTVWWGSHELGLKETALCQVGPLKLWVSREKEEWRLAWERSVPPVDEVAVRHGAEEDPPPIDASLSRFGVRQTSSEFFLYPALADRAYVVNPETPFFLPPGEKARLFISTPLRIRFQTGPDEVPLWEEPSVRSSDTWFGQNTRAGEVCYASRTRALTSLQGELTPPNRAVSVVWIENKASSLLPLEKLKLPMPAFSLYASGGVLWTETARLVREADDERAELHLERHAPEEAGEASLLVGPREPVDKNQLISVFGGLFK